MCSPGPTPLPILGNLIKIASASKYAFLGLHKLAQEYGPVFSLWLGQYRVVVVSGKEELKVREETLNNVVHIEQSFV